MKTSRPGSSSVSFYMYICTHTATITCDFHQPTSPHPHDEHDVECTLCDICLYIHIYVHVHLHVHYSYMTLIGMHELHGWYPN